VSFASFAVQSYQDFGSFLPLDQNKFTHLGCSHLNYFVFAVLSIMKQDENFAGIDVINFHNLLLLRRNHVE
jgi:hypothetical protein